MNFIIIVLFGLVFHTANAAQIQPFKSDGCSIFPDGTIKLNKLWFKCCFEHDIAYWKGGTYLQRINADEILKQCVADVGEPIIAQLMLAGVRAGGSPYIPSPFRWGYGWPYMRGYKTLTDEELIETNLIIKNLVIK